MGAERGHDCFLNESSGNKNKPDFPLSLLPTDASHCSRFHALTKLISYPTNGKFKVPRALPREASALFPGRS